MRKMEKTDTQYEYVDSIQAIIDLYKKDVDRTLIRENLKFTAEERLLNWMNFLEFAEELRRAGKKLRKTGLAKK